MIKVFIVDDHPVVRRGLRQIIENQPDMEVTGEAKSAGEFYSLLPETDCTLVTLDIQLPDKNGLDVLKHVKSQRPNLPVLILTIHAEDCYAMRFIKAGASGYLTKDGTPAELLKAIRKIGLGGRYVSPSLAEKLIFDRDATDRPPHETLSDRELQVMCMVAEGNSLKEIAETLCIGTKTVSTYHTRIMKKMGTSTNAELTRYALENHLI